jgi:hypothetical protein
MTLLSRIYPKRIAPAQQARCSLITAMHGESLRENVTSGETD